MLWVWCSVLLVLQANFISCIRPRWPGGSYGLLKPITGCPRRFNGRGFFFQDTVDANPRNNRSDILHIDGYVAKGDVLRYFCTKADGTGSSKVRWPGGQYCIYRTKDTTVDGMETGSICMYDEKYNNKDTFKINSVLVDIEWTLSWNYDYTELYFACQTSGNKKIPISLPITKPFYLLPYESRDCQQVKWMVATSEWIKYNTRNYKTKRENQKEGTVPYHELGRIYEKGITMFYCYYQSCKYTLTDKKGVFQSPGFPGKYPDGQLCSWRIMVPDNHTVRVIFTDFSLNGSNTDDYLRFSVKIKGRYRINETFHGAKQPFNVTANAKIMFLFRSDKDSNGYGFRAEYHVFTSRDHGNYQNHDKDTTTPRTIPSKNTGTTQSTMQPSLKPTSSNPNDPDKGVYKKSHSTTSLGRTGTITAIMIPLAFATIGILLIILILYRCRSKPPKRNTSDARQSVLLDQANTTVTANTTVNDDTRTFPPLSRDTDDEYESPDDLKEQKGSKSHTNIANDAPEYHVLESISAPDDGQMYQPLSSDKQPEYEAPNYFKHTPDPNIDPDGTPEYHELEPMENNVPEVVYDVLEGPDYNDGSSDDHMYQALDKDTTHNPLSLW